MYNSIMNEYAIIWFEDNDNFTLFNRKGLVTLTREQALSSEDIAGILETEADVDDAQDDLRYAISLQLLDILYGYDKTLTSG